MLATNEKMTIVIDDRSENCHQQSFSHFNLFSISDWLKATERTNLKGYIDVGDKWMLMTLSW